MSGQSEGALAKLANHRSTDAGLARNDPNFSEHFLLPETVSQAERRDWTKQSRRWCETFLLLRPPQSTLWQRRGFRHLSGAPYIEPPPPSPSYSATSKAQIAISEFHISDLPPPPSPHPPCLPVSEGEAGALLAAGGGRVEDGDGRDDGVDHGDGLQLPPPFPPPPPSPPLPAAAPVATVAGMA